MKVIFFGSLIYGVLAGYYASHSILQFILIVAGAAPLGFLCAEYEIRHP